MIGCFFALCRLAGAIRAPRISRRLVEKRALWVDSAQKKKPGVIPAFLLHTCLSAEDRPKSASLPIYFLPHLDKRKSSKIPLSATQKKAGREPGSGKVGANRGKKKASCPSPLADSANITDCEAPFI